MGYLAGIPKTVLFNLRNFPLKIAMKMPVVLSSSVKLGNVKGTVVIESDQITPCMIRIGGNESRRYPRSVWSNLGKVVFRGGGASFGQGCVISVGENATLDIGGGFRAPHRTEIQCFRKIRFGHDCLVSWDCLFMDTDFHRITCKSEVANADEPISIGNHVWVGCRTTVLKGANIPDGCVVGANSNVVSEFQLENCVLAGNPARSLRDGVSWQE